jgi:hypothetical protein
MKCKAKSMRHIAVKADDVPLMRSRSCCHHVIGERHVHDKALLKCSALCHTVLSLAEMLLHALVLQVY